MSSQSTTPEAKVPEKTKSSKSSSAKYFITIPAGTVDEEKWIAEKSPGLRVVIDKSKNGKLYQGTCTDVYKCEAVKSSDTTSSPSDDKNHKVSPKALAVRVLHVGKIGESFSRKAKSSQLKLVYQICKSQHPRILQLYEMYVSRKTVYSIVEHAVNGTVQDVMRAWRTPALPETWVRYWALQIAEGIGFLHSRGIAHRNLKLENCLIDAKNSLKLTGFSLSSRCVYADRQPIVHKTVVGTMQYIAPEVIQKQPYDARIADMWSMGVVLYVMRAGHFPWTDPNNRDKLIEEQMLYRWKRCASEDGMSPEMMSIVGHMLDPIAERRWGIFKLMKKQWFSHHASKTPLPVKVVGEKEIEDSEKITTLI